MKSNTGPFFFFLEFHSMIGYSWSAILSISLWGWEGCVVPRCLTSRLFSRASWPAILAPSHPRYSTDGTFLGLPLFFIKGCVSLFCPKLPRSTGVGVGAGLGAGVGVVVVVVLFVDRAGAVVWAEPEVWFWVWVWTGTDVSWFELRVFDGVTSGGRSLGLRPLFLPVAPFFTSFLMPLLWGSIGFLLLAVMLVVARNQFCNREHRWQVWQSYTKKTQLLLHYYMCLCYLITQLSNSSCGEHASLNQQHVFYGWTLSWYCCLLIYLLFKLILWWILWYDTMI